MRLQVCCSRGYVLQHDDQPALRPEHSMGFVNRERRVPGVIQAPQRERGVEAPGPYGKRLAEPDDEIYFALEAWERVLQNSPHRIEPFHARLDEQVVPRRREIVSHHPQSSADVYDGTAKLAEERRKFRIVVLEGSNGVGGMPGQLTIPGLHRGLPERPRRIRFARRGTQVNASGDALAAAVAAPGTTRNIPPHLDAVSALRACQQCPEVGPQPGGFHGKVAAGIGEHLREDEAHSLQ